MFAPSCSAPRARETRQEISALLVVEQGPQLADTPVGDAEALGELLVAGLVVGFGNGLEVQTFAMGGDVEPLGAVVDADAAVDARPYVVGDVRGFAAGDVEEVGERVSCGPGESFWL